MTEVNPGWVTIFINTKKVGVLPISVKRESVDINLRKEIETESGQNLSACYLCGKCSAGCPVAPYQDVPPHVIMRMAQTGNTSILETSMIWNCVSCGTCYTRCPNAVDPARVCEATAIIAKKYGMVTGKPALALREKFVESIKNNGRVHELTLAMQMKVATGDLFGDIGMGIPMLLKGKLPIKGNHIKNIEGLQKLFADRTDPVKESVKTEKAKGDK
jgi:heterodisulfide reductase subunit C